jgi:hypothetical protein
MHGRLVYWLPTTHNDEFTTNNLIMHPCFRVIARSLQMFGKWGRWLITAEKIADFVEMDAKQLIGVEGIPTRRALRQKVYSKADCMTATSTTVV